MIYCFYHHLNAMALYKDDQANPHDFFPVSEADKTFFKTSFHDLSQLFFKIMNGNHSRLPSVTHGLML